MAAINCTDMTTGSIWKRMVSFAVPVFWGNLSASSNNNGDSVIVEICGQQALAAVASSGNLIFMMTGFMGSVHRRGHRHCPVFSGPATMKRSAPPSIRTLLALCCGVLLTLLGVFFTPHHPWPGCATGGRAGHLHSVFPAVLLGSRPPSWHAGMGILQAVGDSRSPLYYLVISSAVNGPGPAVCGGHGYGRWQAPP